MRVASSIPFLVISVVMIWLGVRAFVSTEWWHRFRIAVRTRNGDEPDRHEVSDPSPVLDVLLPGALFLVGTVALLVSALALASNVDGLLPSTFANSIEYRPPRGDLFLGIWLTIFSAICLVSGIRAWIDRSWWVRKRVTYVNAEIFNLDSKRHKWTAFDAALATILIAIGTFVLACTGWELVDVRLLS